MGQLTITDHDGRAVAPEGLPPRARQVLGVLAAQHDRLLSKDGLADAIWGDRPPDKFVAALEHYVSVLRRRLEPGRPRAESFIVTRAGGYLFATDRAALDLAEVRELVAHGDAWPAGTPERVALRQRLIDAATALPFAEDEYATWAAGPRAEVRAAMITAHVEVGSAVEPVDPEQALRLARRAIDLDRYAERPYQIAMRASAALGRQDEALRWYEQCSRSLRAELGVDPADETRRLRDRIAADRVTALPVRTGTPHQTLHAGDGAPARDHPATAAHPRRRAGQVGADATLVPAIGPDQLAPDRGRWGRTRRDARRAPDGVLRRLPLRLMDTGPGA
ncbi:MAG TPA: BTAD domain-containing putative transcriptional regulator, partial [Pilimelia sp.]|nr:BTAD domain-containing putative transcriptional regulator [Pilimelia sp.]